MIKVILAASISAILLSGCVPILSSQQALSDTPAKIEKIQGIDFISCAMGSQSISINPDKIMGLKLDLLNKEYPIKLELKDLKSEKKMDGSITYKAILVENYDESSITYRVQVNDEVYPNGWSKGSILIISMNKSDIGSAKAFTVNSERCLITKKA